MLEESGFEHHVGSALPVLADLRLVLENIPIERGGARLRGVNGLRALIAGHGSIRAVAALHLSAAARPVRALLFDKSKANNSALGWHQDLTIAVVERHNLEGFGPWTVKAGMVHVEPAPSLQAAMITLRIHLDDVRPDNAPLIVAAGSHRLGPIPQEDIGAIVQSSRIVRCPAKAEDIWAYRHLSCMLRRPRPSRAP